MEGRLELKQSVYDLDWQWPTYQPQLTFNTSLNNWVSSSNGLYCIKLLRWLTVGYYVKCCAIILFYCINTQFQLLLWLCMSITKGTEQWKESSWCHPVSHLFDKHQTLGHMTVACVMDLLSAHSLVCSWGCLMCTFAEKLELLLLECNTHEYVFYYFLEGMFFRLLKIQST